MTPVCTIQPEYLNGRGLKLSNRSQKLSSFWIVFFSSFWLNAISEAARRALLWSCRDSQRTQGSHCWKKSTGSPVWLDETKLELFCLHLEQENEHKLAYPHVECVVVRSLSSTESTGLNRDAADHFFRFFCPSSFTSWWLQWIVFIMLPTAERFKGCEYLCEPLYVLCVCCIKGRRDQHIFF